MRARHKQRLVVFDVDIYGHKKLIPARTVGNAVRLAFRSLSRQLSIKPLVSNSDGGWHGVSATPLTARAA